jgi:hypothetical protein
VTKAKHTKKRLTIREMYGRLAMPFVQPVYGAILTSARFPISCQLSDDLRLRRIISPICSKRLRRTPLKNEVQNGFLKRHIDLVTTSFHCYSFVS